MFREIDNPLEEICLIGELIALKLIVKRRSADSQKFGSLRAVSLRPLGSF